MPIEPAQQVPNPTLIEAAARVPPGRWGVAVSGGADSVALLSLLHDRAARDASIQLHVVHLDHQTRDGASGEDAEFVQSLARQWGLPVHVARRDQVEPANASPMNRSARFRRARLEWFTQVVRREHLDGVVLAHHADDQVESVMLRLLRGSSYAGLTGMAFDRTIRGVRLIRPLLDVPRAALREYLRASVQGWREDASNASPEYARNRVRQLLATRPALSAALCELGESCRGLSAWVTSVAPVLPERFAVEQLARLPHIVARRAAREWLRRCAVPADELSNNVTDRLIKMAIDAASPARTEFPGRVVVRRQGGQIWRDA